LKAHQILELPETELASRINNLKLKELERLTEKLTTRLCDCSYQELMRVAIRAVPKLTDDNRFASLQKSLNPYLKDEFKTDNDKLKRLTLLVMLVIARKFKQIHEG